MKVLFLLLVSVLLLDAASAQTLSENPVPMKDRDGRMIYGRSGTHHWQPYMSISDMSDYSHAPESAYEDYQDMKYGLRIHWGIYAFEHGQESWVLNRNKSLEYQARYHDLYKTWYPAGFNADEWADLMKDNGFTYFVFTAKHHEGFSMYDTKTRINQRVAFNGVNAGKIVPTDMAYSIMETPFKRDVTKELVDASRKRGLKIGLYYSHPDWFDADFRFDEWNPNRDSTYSPQTQPEAWARFQARHQGQIRELLTNYGKVDMLCFDMWFPAFTWPYMQQTIKEARNLQPNCMFRWRGFGNFGDYHTPENYIPGDESMGTMAWMVIHSLSKRRYFSYEPEPTQFHDGPWIVSKLIDMVSKGGNLMVGLGPDPSGKFHPEAIAHLRYAGDWLKVNGEAIYATRAFTPTREGERLYFTRSKDSSTVYGIHEGWPGKELLIKSVKPRKGSDITMLGYAKPLRWQSTKEGIRIELPAEMQEEASRPCRQAYSFKITR